MAMTVNAKGSAGRRRWLIRGVSLRCAGEGNTDGLGGAERSEKTHPQVSYESQSPCRIYKSATTIRTRNQAPAFYKVNLEAGRGRSIPGLAFHTAKSPGR